MARIRTIKPEFWRSPATAKASPWARLLYIAMWNWADDYGVAEWTPRELLGFAFPNDEHITTAEFQRLCKEVSDCFETEFYTVGERRYYRIPSWDEHQKTERRANPKNPVPDDAESAPDQAFCEVKEKRGTSSPSRGKTPAGKGTGEQGKGNRYVQDKPALVDIEFDEWWSIYPRKQAKKPARLAFTRIRKTVPLETLMDGVRSYALLSIGVERDKVKLPAGWLNDERWADEQGTSVPTPVRRAAAMATECPDHPGYPLPCAACEREGRNF